MSNFINPQIGYGFLWVMLGGGLGAGLRFWLANAYKVNAGGLPYATLTANVLGCFLLGLLLTQRDRLSVSVFLALTTGFCGGLTTFSTLIYELWSFAEKDRNQMFLYFFLTLLTGISAFGLGYKGSFLLRILGK